MKMPTVKNLLQEAKQQLKQLHKDENVARVLLSHLLQKEYHEIYLMMEDEVSDKIVKKFKNGMEEYFQGKPIQYIKGVETFFGRDFEINENVLIPRYETEELVENVLTLIQCYFKDQSHLNVCDVGTGSGAIAITLKSELPSLNVIATDISDKALDVAKNNSLKHHTEITFYQGDMIEPLIHHKVKADVFISNPPYIKESELLDEAVKNYEPHLALFGGKDGLYFYHKIFQSVSSILNDRAILAFEIGYDQKESLSKAVEYYFKDAEYEIVKDINGKDRMLFIYKNIEKK